MTPTTGPDNLRDRIAAVSRCCRWHKPNAPCDDFGCNNPPTDWDYELADAVIAALNIAKACESGCVWQIPSRVEDMSPQQRELLKREETNE